MSDAKQEMELTEAERLEFNRRADVASAIIPAAVRLFGERDELEERIKSESKAAGSYWYWIVFAGGMVVHYFLSGGGSWMDWGSFNWGTWIALMAIGGWFVKQYNFGHLKLKHDLCIEKLYEMEMVWNGATGDGDFWSISKFVSELDFDREGDDFCNWWAEHRTRILQRVSGWEKGKRIGGEWAKSDTEFRRSLRDSGASE